MRKHAKVSVAILFETVKTWNQQELMKNNGAFLQ